jgi:hypothetical protein
MNISGPCTYVEWKDYDWHHSIQCDAYIHGPKIHWNPAVFALLGAAHAVGLFITCEVFVRTFTTFNKWRTIYFW